MLEASRLPLRPILLAAVVALGVAACDRNAAPASEGDRAPVVGTVDSALPIDTLLRRFRATLPDTPTVLAGGAASPEALVRELFSALGRSDEPALRALAITPAEFAWLYYPQTTWTGPPYAMGPELVWFQVSASSDKGLARLVNRYAGRSLRLEALLCPDTVRVGGPGSITEGPASLTEGCRVRFAVADSAPREFRIFGSLLNRDGRYKFVSYSNDL